MAKYKENPRYEIVTFRTTKARKEALAAAAGNKKITMSELIDQLLQRYEQDLSHGDIIKRILCEK